MIVMPANSTGPWHVPARETGRLGHLYSPGDQRGPYPHFPYALDNGAFSCWTRKTNKWDEDKWQFKEPAWRKLLNWAYCEDQKPLWALVPDVPGHAAETIARWAIYAPLVAEKGFVLAVAVQDGMTPKDVRKLSPNPKVVFIGGSDEYKWGSVEMWCQEAEHVHVGRNNRPLQLDYLMGLGVKSSDGTGWNRGDPKQTRGLIEWLYRNKRPLPNIPEVPHYLFSRSQRDKQTELKFLVA